MTAHPHDELAPRRAGRGEPPVPPTTDTADEQLERGVLGALLLAPDVEAAERLITALGEPANFDRPRVAEVWQIASQQWATTGRADIHSVIAALRANRRPIDPLWVLGCTDVDHTPATQQHALDWAVHVADKGRRRRVVEELTRALQQAENGVDGVGDTLARIERLQAVPGVTGTTWRPVDPAQLRDNPEPLPTPTILCRDDGTALLYPGRVNAIYGEPSGGKTWLALLAVKHQLDAGQGVLYVDFEDRAPAVYGRLELLGVDPDVLYDPARFGYCRIDETVTAPGAMNDLTAALDRLRPSLVVIDGVGESMSLEQLNPYDNPDVVTWWSRLPRHITRHSAEPAVLLIDHVVKDTQTRGSWAIGAQAKVASIDGAAYTLDGIPDQLVSAFGYNNYQGRMYVFDGKTGALRLKIDDPSPQGGGPDAGALFGFQDASPFSPGAVDSSGAANIYGNGFTQNGPAGQGQGEAWVFDGLTGKVRYVLNDPTPTGGGQFGFSETTTDYNKDGTPDLYIGQSPHHVPGANEDGGSYVLDGKTGKLLKAFELPPGDSQPSTPTNGGPRLGWDVAAPGDLNHDGQPDYIASATYIDVGANMDQGRVYVFLSHDRTKPAKPTVHGQRRTHSSRPLYRFATRDADSPLRELSFRCSFDSRHLHRCFRAFGRRLKPGRHILRVQALDIAKNRSRVKAILITVLK